MLLFYELHSFSPSAPSLKNCHGMYKSTGENTLQYTIIHLKTSDFRALFNFCPCEEKAYYVPIMNQIFRERYAYKILQTQYFKFIKITIFQYYLLFYYLSFSCLIKNFSFHNSNLEIFYENVYNI